MQQYNVSIHLFRSTATTTLRQVPSARPMGEIVGTWRNVVVAAGAMFIVLPQLALIKMNHKATR